MRSIQRLSSEISSINIRIRNHVYRSSWDVDALRTLREQLADRKAQMERLYAELPRAATPPEPRPMDLPRAEDLMTVEGTRRIASLLFSQRPPEDESEAWKSFTRICTAMMQLLGNELVVDPAFDAREFLLSCGIGEGEVERIFTAPGEILRGEEQDRL